MCAWAAIRRSGYNLGGDINARQGKINFFASGMYNQNKGAGEGTTHPATTSSATRLSDVTAGTSSTNMNGLVCQWACWGLDYFINNRNTLTFSGMLDARQVSAQ
jgi:hypothetical protein